MTGELISMVVWLVVITIALMASYAVGHNRGYNQALKDINESGWTVTRKK